MSRPASHPLRKMVLELYDELDGEIAAAGPVCEISGRCCRFEEFGHRLYMCRPEAEILLEHGLPDDCDVSQAVEDRNRCPFQHGRLCTARDNRPLGCRMYYCDPAFQDTLVELSERYVSRLKEAHEATDTAWEYRPLHEFLSEYAKNRT